MRSVSVIYSDRPLSKTFKFKPVGGNAAPATGPLTEPSFKTRKFQKTVSDGALALILTRFTMLTAMSYPFVHDHLLMNFRRVSRKG